MIDSLGTEYSTRRDLSSIISRAEKRKLTCRELVEVLPRRTEYSTWPRGAECIGQVWVLPQTGLLFWLGSSCGASAPLLRHAKWGPLAGAAPVRPRKRSFALALLGRRPVRHLWRWRRALAVGARILSLQPAGLQCFRSLDSLLILNCQLDTPSRISRRLYRPSSPS